MPFARAVRRSPLLIFLVLASSVPLGAAVYTVSPDGNDSAAGTEEAPWKTLVHAAAAAVAGDVVEVRGGTYAERVVFSRSGTAGAPIVFRARAGETPIIDGASFTVGSGWYPLFTLTNISHVTIQGFELKNLRTTQRNRVPIGILVNGSGTGVRLLDNHIHELGTTYSGSSGGDAHGIAVYGDANSPIADIVIRGNRLHHLSLGSSEALVLNGNISGFLVEGNVVHDCNNIGIDAIGHEGTCPDAAQDAARNGIIRANTVYGILSFGNPAYGNNYSAGGIYVDGGRDILIERNTIRECDIGIELASEHAGQATSGVTVRNNLVYRNRIGGLFMGGYDTKRGRTENCRVEHNTFFENDTLQYGNGEIQLQFDVRSTVLRQNIIVTNAQRLVVGNPYTQNTDVTFDYNIVHAPGTPRWQWKKANYSGWSAWRAGSGQDEHSLFADPGLLDPMNGGFALRPRSPAIDAGVPAFVPAPGETDHAGRPRLRGVRVDIGALEFDLEEFSAGGEIEPTLLELSANEARLTLRRRADWAAWSLVYRIQTATTLAPSAWTDVASTPAGVEPIAPSNGAERAVFAFAAPGAPCWFARVKIDVGP
jgi:Protein of unknown function (DUF1565).